jgi:hypothetical protein
MNFDFRFFTEPSHMGCPIPIRTESEPPRRQVRQVRQDLGLLALGELGLLGALAVFSRCVERMATTYVKKLDKPTANRQSPIASP